MSGARAGRTAVVGHQKGERFAEAGLGISIARIASEIASEKNYEDGAVADAAIENVLSRLEALTDFIENK